MLGDKLSNTQARPTILALKFLISGPGLEARSDCWISVKCFVPPSLKRGWVAPQPYSSPRNVESSYTDLQLKE